MTLRQIDPTWYAVVDRRDGSEIAGAFAADEDTGEVHYVEPRYQGKGAQPGATKLVRIYHCGIRIVRRSKPQRPNPNVYGVANG